MSLQTNPRWRQFSLRGLLVLVTIAAILSAWFAWRLKRAHAEDDAVADIVRAGGEVAYSNQFYGGVSRLTPYPPRESRVGAWSRRVFGADPFRTVVSVKLFDDDSLSLISQHSLTGLEIIRLEGGASITDRGLVHLRGCKRLRVLLLENAQITDAGLENIRDCKKLEELWLHGTQVTDASLPKLAAFRALFVIDLRNTQITDDGLKTIASLPAIALLYLDGGSITDNGLKNLSASRTLESLWLGDQSSADLNLAILSDFPALNSITLTGSLITDDRVQALARNNLIQQLKLQGCTRLTDESLATLATLPNLESLGVTSTPFTPQAINEFKANRPNCTLW